MALPRPPGTEFGRDRQARVGNEKCCKPTYLTTLYFRPCFLELLQASGCAHYVEVWVQEAWYN